MSLRMAACVPAPCNISYGGDLQSVRSGSGMLLQSRVMIAAPLLAGLQAQDGNRSGRLRSAGFLSGSASRLWVKGVVHPAYRAERGRAGDRRQSKLAVRALGDPSQSTFLSLEEAGLVEMAELDMHEKFLTRLTVSSLNLLRTISEQEGVPIEELTAGKVCDWFVKDKEKRARNIDEATLKWESPEW